jgi:ABC-type xylose transport system permease subunit
VTTPALAVAVAGLLEAAPLAASTERVAGEISDAYEIAAGAARPGGASLG